MTLAGLAEVGPAPGEYRRLSAPRRHRGTAAGQQGSGAAGREAGRWSVSERPYVLLSAAMSADGYLDDATPVRLVLSDPADLDRVDGVRAACDAIMVGAETVRRDNPALSIRSPQRRERRVAAGLPATPARVTLTGSGDLDPAARFFTAGDAARLVYVPASAVAAAQARLGAAATVIGAGDPLTIAAVLSELACRGVGRLMVEGGARTLSQFIAAGLADELQLAIAPVFVADPAAPRLLQAGPGRGGPPPGRLAERMELAGAGQAGDMAVLRYLFPRRPGS